MWNWVLSLDWSLLAVAVGLFGIKFQFKIPNPVTAIQRVVTINPQSFTPANIARAGASVAVFTNPVTGVANSLTGGTFTNSFVGSPAQGPLAQASAVGLSQSTVSVQGTPIIQGSSQKNTGFLQSYYTGALSYGRTQSGSPNQPETFVNTISRLLGGASSAYTTGQVLGPAVGGGKVGALISTSSTGYATSQFGQGILTLFGQKIGGAILALLSGNIAQAVQIVTTNPPNVPNIFGPNGGQSFGGGGGGGFLPSQNTGQSTALSAIIPIMGIGFVALAFWYFLRKKA
jgi:hypothetical protein